MKKIIALMLCLAVALSCAFAMAETAEKSFTGELTVNGRFTVKWVAPEGYFADEVQSGDSGFMVLLLKPDESNADKPMMMVSIAPDELLWDVQRLNDLDDETLAQIEATFRAEDEVEITYLETAYGTKLMMVKETYENVDFVDFYTIYMGYEIELVLMQSQNNAGVSLTDEQIATVIQFLSDMEFIPAE